MSHRLLSLLAGLLCTAVLAPASAHALAPSTPDAPAYDVNGRVNAIVRVGDTIYIGGSFSTVNGQPRTNLAAISAADGSLTPWSPTPDNDVNAMVAAGSTIYIGGRFSSVTDGAGPHTRHALAAVDTAGAVTSWDPDAGATGAVWSLAISGSRVYAGGQFTTLGTGGSQITETNLGAVDAATGTPVGWATNPPNPPGTVLALEPSPDGTLLYVGGGFNTIGQPAPLNRLGVAAVRTSDGVVDPAWDPSDPVGGSGADDFAIGPAGTIYIVGDFFGPGVSMGGQPRNYVAEVEPAGAGRTGVATSFAPDTDSEAFSVARAPDAVYIGGFFSSVNNTRTVQNRDGLAAVDTGIGDAFAWDPGPGTNVVSLLVADDGSLYAGGTFTGGFVSFSPPPAATTAPEITGTPEPGQTLTCTQGAWSGAVPQTYSTQFLSDAAPVGAAGSSTYTVTAADAGHAIGCAVTAHNRRADVTANAAAVTVPVAVTQQPPPQQSPQTTLPPPAFRRSANLYPLKGTVTVRLPGTSRFVPISQPAQIPFGSVVDATRGTVRVCTADRAGKVSCSNFYGGRFRLTQLAGARPITVLTLVGGNFKRCPRTSARRADAAAKRRKPKSIRHIWGEGSGAFRTVGRYASATIRGTTWLTDDRCGGTLIRVKRGSVTVRDLVKRKSRALRAPRKYLAKAPKRRA